MNQVVACYRVYDDEALLKSSLDTVVKHVDRVIAWSGKWRDDKQSNQSTNHILKQYGVEIIPYKPNLTETEVSNYTFKHVSNGDIIFWIDGDDLVVGDLSKAVNEVKSDSKSFLWTCETFNNGSPWMYQPRFMRQRPDFEMKDKHYHYYFENNCVYDGGDISCPHKKIDSIKVINCNIFRPEARNQERVIYREFMSGKHWLD